MATMAWDAARRMKRGSKHFEGKRLDARLTGRAETPAVELAPLAPDVINEAIPAFFVGRNGDGLWVAREARGRIGGIFLFKRSALCFAEAESGPTGGATIFPSERFELDLDNRGNPLTGHLARVMRVATAHLGLIKRVCLCALAVLLTGGAMAGIIALKTAIFFSRFGLGAG